ncbi:tetratricopeptide repeat protein [Lignipirellula cremea]|uniref:Photosystem I assembly protein Ycf3 n=1 Tax=Lignipirellula cremea TaxID=2528010 RepID=A0A518DSD3_9BACT|nr:tetratricopeptide repeat protein [Lignipirellula cremea]QDU94756.1 photosystem I assembly protein Ycf3 [Lignipirellula cremea]
MFVRIAGFLAVALSCLGVQSEEIEGIPFEDPFFVDPVTELKPRDPRDEEQTFRVEAAARYAYGRVLEQRDQDADALRQYERAWRYDPSAFGILQKIVPLAFSLKRTEEAARYAVMAVERDPTDANLLLRLAYQLSENGDYARAVSLYAMAQRLETEETDQDASFVLSRMQMGKLYFLLGQHEKARKPFETVQQALADPDKFQLNQSLQNVVIGEPSQAYALIAENELQCGRYASAEELFAQSNAAKKNSPVLAFHLARIAEKQEKTAAALKHLNTYLEAKVDDAGKDPYTLLAKLMAQQYADPEQASAALRERLAELYQEDAANYVLGYFYAQQLWDAEQADLAETVFHDMLQLRPTVEGYQALIEIYQQQKDYPQLLKTLGMAVSQAGSLDALGEPVEKLLADKAIVKKLIALARKQVADGQTLDQGVALATALAALHLKDFAAADPMIELAIAAGKPSPAGVMASWGLELMSADEYDRSAAVFRRAIDEGVQPQNNAAFHYYMSGALEMAGRTDEALKSARMAAAEEPTSSSFHARVAWISYHAGRYAEARQSYKQLLARFDKDYDSAEVRKVMRDARMALSNIEVHLDNMPAAEEWLEQVLDEYPEQLGAYNDLGYLWADQGKNLHRALKMAEQAAASEPDNMAYQDTLGWAYYRLGRAADAVSELTKAAADEDADGVIHDHLGDALLANSEPKKAVDAWRQAIKKFDPQKDQKRIQATRQKIKQQS